MLEDVLAMIVDDYTDYLHPAITTRPNNYHEQCDQLFYPDPDFLPAPSHNPPAQLPVSARDSPIFGKILTQDLCADRAPGTSVQAPAAPLGTIPPIHPPPVAAPIVQAPPIVPQVVVPPPAPVVPALPIIQVLPTT